ncbi:hypothetical protein [Devosia sp. 2618]|uniref:hypothetical protein n=1 Tax=Devosia sp. 2618 TaxID=3156454 RepID=UPI0033947482
MGMTPSRRTMESLKLADMALDNRLYVVRCNLCRRTSHFLARDLVRVYGAERPAMGVFTKCSRCGKSQYLQVSTRLPDLDDDGALVIRRPTAEWKWVDEVFVDEDRLPASARELWRRKR